MMGDALVHNGDNFGNEKRKNGKKTKWEGELCYSQGYSETPPLLGNSPIPSFPFAWVPKKRKGKEVFSPDNPFNTRNLSYRLKATEKVVKEMSKWSKGLEPPKRQKFEKMAVRIERCNSFSVALNDESGEVAGDPLGHPYLKSDGRCNSRFCQRCSKKNGRRALERIFKKCGIDPENPPAGLRMLTLTMPGEPGALLQDRYNRLRKALKKLYKTNLWANRVKASIGKMEVTRNGENWHTHAHFIITGDFLPNEALRTVWAECLGVDFEKINYPWIERCKGGKRAFWELAKYIAKPVSIIGRAKDSEDKKKKGISETAKEWNSAAMGEYFDTFSNARIFTTTGEFKAVPTEEKKEKEIYDLTTEEEEKEKTLKEIITACPINYEAALNGHTESLNTIILDCELSGYTKSQVNAEFIYLNVFFEKERPDSVHKRWTSDADKIESARRMQAIHWERMRVYREELKRARQELQDICEKTGAFF
jgi:hypothetical protein